MVTFGFMALWLIPPFFNLQQSLPLHLSDVLRVVTGYALWSRRPWALALTYYWGLTLNPQALLTSRSATRHRTRPGDRLLLGPARTGQWAVIYLTWGLGLHPNRRSYRLTLLVTVGWAAVVFVINRALGTNYGYLNGKPGGASLLDLLGDWPWYLLAALAVAAVVWALITWPWTLRTRTQQ